MHVVIVLYPGFTAIDAFGAFEVLGRLPGVRLDFVAERPGLVRNDLGSLAVEVRLGLEDVPSPDVVVVGGGPGQVDQMSGRLVDWLREVDETATWMVAVSTGTLILAATGLLDGRPATSHWGASEELAALGAVPSSERVVIDGHHVTGAGISDGIDLSLVLAGLLAGDLEAQTVQLIMEYAPEPPYRAGSLATAPADVVEHALAKLAARFPGIRERVDLSAGPASTVPSPRAG